jgi:hypothetical protein
MEAPTPCFVINGTLVKHDGDRSQRRDRPPENKAHFEGQLRHAEVAADPRESAPDQRRTENPEKPAAARNQPEEQAASGSSRRFLGAHANAELRARGKITWDSYGSGAERMEKILCQRRFAGTIRALVEMCAEPSLIGGRKAFDERLG